jgi:hypothetical protein
MAELTTTPPSDVDIRRNRVAVAAIGLLARVTAPASRITARAG